MDKDPKWLPGWETVFVVFVADDLAAWLTALLADAGRKKLTTLMLGTDQERALRSAATAAVRLTAEQLCPDDAGRAEVIALVVSQVFNQPAADLQLVGDRTMLEELQAGIVRQLAVLDDVDMTSTEQSSSDVLGVPSTVVSEKLTSYLLREIVTRGARGGPLLPLASQLNHDVTHLQGSRLENMMGRLVDQLTGFEDAKSHAAISVARAHVKIAEQGQIADRYAKAVDQLGSEKLYMRVGGIFSLERLANDSAEDRPSVMELLSMFVREHSQEQWPLPDPGDYQGKSIRPDVQAAITVLGRRQDKKHRVDLASSDLTQADLRAADLRGADLRGVILYQASLNNAKLNGAWLSDANLNYAILRDADLTEAQLHCAQLRNASLSHATIRSGNLTSADLARAYLPDADLTEATARGADLNSAELAGANLSSADFTGADFSRANLTGANLTGAKLTEAKLTEAKLFKAKLTRAKLARASICGATLLCADLDGAILNDADLSGTELAGASCILANLSNAQLSNADLRKADLTRAAFLYSDLRGANLSGAILTRTDLYGAQRSEQDPTIDGWQRDPDSGRLGPATR